MGEMVLEVFGPKETFDTIEHRMSSEAPRLVLVGPSATVVGGFLTTAARGNCRAANCGRGGRRTKLFVRYSTLGIGSRRSLIRVREI